MLAYNPAQPAVTVFRFSFVIHRVHWHPWNSSFILLIYVCILPLNIYYKSWNEYRLNRINKLQKWLIPFHAIWGLCWYDLLKCNSINRHFTPALPRHSKELQPVHSNALDFADFECKDWRAVKEWCTSFPSEMLGCFAQIRHTDFEALRNSVLVRWTLWIEQWRNGLLP